MNAQQNPKDHIVSEFHFSVVHSRAIRNANLPPSAPGNSPVIRIFFVAFAAMPALVNRRM
jgi:hypothetical protein